MGSAVEVGELRSGGLGSGWLGLGSGELSSSRQIVLASNRLRVKSAASSLFASNRSRQIVMYPGIQAASCSLLCKQ